MKMEQKKKPFSGYIVLLCADPNNQHVLSSALALVKFGYEVSVLAYACSPGVMAKCEVRRVGSWIPMSLCGLFRYPLYVIRSVYTAIRCLCRQRSVPRLVLSDCSCMALPVLAQLGCTLVHWQQPCECLPRWLYRWTLSYAQEVLVTNRCIRDQLILARRISSEPKICYPCVDTNYVSCDNTLYGRGKGLNVMFMGLPMPKDGLLFVAYDDFCSSSNLELAVKAFVGALHALPWKVACKCWLVLAGHLQDNNSKQCKYHEKILYLVRSTMYSHHICVLTNLPANHKKNLLERSLCLLCTRTNPSFDPTVLEAMWLGKAVVAVNTGFASEVMDHATAFLLPPEEAQFALVIYKLANNAVLRSYIGELAKTDFKNRYSLEAYGKLLDHFVQKRYFSSVQNEIMAYY